MSQIRSCLNTSGIQSAFSKCVARLSVYEIGIEMRFWVLTFLILGPIGLSASFAGVTASPKPAQVARPQGAPSAPVVPNEVVFKPPPPRNRAFYGDGIPHGPNQPTQNPANNTSEEDVNPPLKPLGSPFGNQTVKQGAF